MVDDLKQIVGTWVAVRPKHAHQTFGRYVGRLRQLPKTDRCIDIIPQDRLACRHVTGKHGVYALFEHSLSELDVPLGAFQQSCSKFSGKRHNVTP